VERFASIYRRPADYFVHANARTEAGFWLASAPGTLVAIDSPARTLGEAVLNALEAGVFDVATPSREQYRSIHAPLLAVARIRSWNALQRAASLCSVWHRGAEISVEPTRNGGLRGDDRGYHPLPEHAVTVAAGCSAADLGAAVRAAFGKCQ
jgi:hypothetical protein